MTTITRLEALELAKKLTGISDVEKLIQAAQQIETYLRVTPAATPFFQTFSEFMVEDLTTMNYVTGSEKLVPWPNQIETASALDSPESKFMFASSRQMGMTTILSAYALWYAMKHANQTVLLLSYQFQQAVEILDRARFAYERMTSARPPVLNNNKSEMIFSNGSRILARSVSTQSNRGLSADVLIIDQMAWLPYSTGSDIWMNLQPIILNAAKVILNSATNEPKGIFYHLWQNDHSFMKMTFPWYVHPDRDDTWMETQKANIGSASFAREYECQFVHKDPSRNP